MLFSKLKFTGNRESAGTQVYAYKPLGTRLLKNSLCEIFLHAAGSTAAEPRKELVPTNGGTAAW